MTDATNNSLNHQARQQAGGVQAQAQANPPRELPTLMAYRYLPVPMRCAVECFLQGGVRTKPRLLELIDHFLTTSGLADCEERGLFTDSAVAHVKRVAYLDGQDGF